MIVAHITKIFDSGNPKAFCTIESDGLMKITGCRIMEGENGLFLKMPTNKYVDGNGQAHYQDIITILNDKYKHILEETAINEYSRVIEQTQENRQEQSQKKSFAQEFKQLISV